MDNMTEQPQDKAQEFMDIVINTLKELKAENAQLKAELEATKKGVEERINQEIDNLAKQTFDGFRKVDEAYAKAIQVNSQPKTEANSWANAIGRIADTIEKAVTGGGNGGGFAGEISQLNEANIKSMLQLQKLDFQALISERAKRLGLPMPSEHVTVEP